MDRKVIIEVTFGDLIDFTAEAVKIGIEKYIADQVEEKLLSQCQAKKMLKIGDPKLKDLILKGKLKTTDNGKIFNSSIHKYMKGEIL